MAPAWGSSITLSMRVLIGLSAMSSSSAFSLPFGKTRSRGDKETRRKSVSASFLLVSPSPCLLVLHQSPICHSVLFLCERIQRFLNQPLVVRTGQRTADDLLGRQRDRPPHFREQFVQCLVPRPLDVAHGPLSGRLGFLLRGGHDVVLGVF